jgi:hypothetical protein
MKPQETSDSNTSKENIVCSVKVIHFVTGTAKKGTEHEGNNYE